MDNRFEESKKRGHEQRDIDPKRVAKFGVWLFILTACSFLIVKLLYSYMMNQQSATDKPLSPLAEVNIVPPEPQLQVSPTQQLNELRSEENIYLNNYGWVSVSNKMVRIPISRAMQIHLKKGFPVREEIK